MTNKISKTNKILTTAGLLSLALTAIHVFGGGPDVYDPLLTSNATDVVKGFASVVWHGVTVSLLICSIMLLIAARSQMHAAILTQIVMVHYLGFAGLFLFYGLTRFGNPWVMTPWIGFLIIIAVAAFGLRRTMVNNTVSKIMTKNAAA